MLTRIARKLSEFVEITDAADELSTVTLFRGQPVRRNLLPSVARKQPGRNRARLERRVVEQLQLLGASHLSATGGTLLDALVVAQHYGLKTRLLDWTSNPLAALWFACSSNSDSDAYVYILDADSLLEKDVYEKDPFEVALTRVFQPRLNNSRIAAQDGWFTLHRYSVSSKRFVPLEENPDTRTHLTEIRIPAADVPGMTDSLARHGVSSRTLYPDLQGLCAFLNWRHLDA